MNYHVALDLTPEQLYHLRLKALQSSVSIKEYATQAVLEKLYPKTDNQKNYKEEET